MLSRNTYSVDCGNGRPQHVSGDALTKSRLDSQDFDGGSKLTAKDSDSNVIQDLGQDSQLVQDSQDSDDTTEDSSSDDDDDYGQDFIPVAVQARRRRRVRQQDLGPICDTRLRQRH